MPAIWRWWFFFYGRRRSVHRKICAPSFRFIGRQCTFTFFFRIREMDGNTQKTQSGKQLETLQQQATRNWGKIKCLEVCALCVLLSISIGRATIQRARAFTKLFTAPLVPHAIARTPPFLFSFRRKSKISPFSRDRNNRAGPRVGRLRKRGGRWVVSPAAGRIARWFDAFPMCVSAPRCRRPGRSQAPVAPAYAHLFPTKN